MGVTVRVAVRVVEGIWFVNAVVIVARVAAIQRSWSWQGQGQGEVGYLRYCASQLLPCVC